MQIAHRVCPICGNKVIESLHTLKFELPANHPLSSGYDVVTCTQCGFVYANTLVDQTDYDLFYTNYSKYEDKTTGTGGVTKIWDHARQENTANQINLFANNHEIAVLDVGCANGGLLQALKNLGYKNIYGIDPSPTCIENTRSLGIACEIGSMSNPFTTFKPDCIILSHTLEHIKNLQQAAYWIHETINKNDEAFIYIEVPDANRYIDYLDSPFQDFNTEHINHFSSQSLQNYLSMNGFFQVQHGSKVIPASANSPYPAIFSFAKESNLLSTFIRDNTAVEKIIQYIVASKTLLAEIDHRIKVSIEVNPKIIVWGTGQLTLKLLIETSLKYAEIIAFVDNNPINQGKFLKGIPIFSPEIIYQYDSPILIASTLHQDEIIKQLLRMKVPNQIVLLK
jgi:hypothetical protein